MKTKIWIGVVVVLLLILVVAAVAFLMLRQGEPDLDADTAPPTPGGGDLSPTRRQDEPELDANQDELEMDPNTVQLSAGCNDVIDVSVLPDDKKMEACKDLIDSRSRDLEERGFVPGECRVDSFEVVDCDPALGTELVCTVRCGDDAE